MANDKVLKRRGESRNMMKTINRRKSKWVKLRVNCVQKQIIEGKFEAKEGRVRIRRMGTLD